MGLNKKLQIKNGFRIKIVNAPENFSLPFDELPENVEIPNDLDGKFDLILLFSLDQEDLDKYAPKLLSHLKDDALFWIAYPKKSSKIKTDISRDNGWEALNRLGYFGVSLISIDETWSGFRFRNEKFIKTK